MQPASRCNDSTALPCTAALILSGCADPNAQRGHSVICRSAAAASAEDTASQATAVHDDAAGGTGSHQQASGSVAGMAVRYANCI